MGRRILIAEDSPTQAERLRSLLEENGYQVDVARNGREGLELVLRAPPDLIISDIGMPEVDGFTFCQEIKAAEATRRIPFVILTVLNTPLDVVIGLERGADNFITKPFDDAYLLERVRRIFENLDVRENGEPENRSVVDVGGRTIAVASDRSQIVELLVAILEEVGLLNEELVESQRLVEDYRSRLAWGEEICAALEEDRYICLYQPILDLRTNQVTRYEVLLRMLDRKGEYVSPGVFLPLLVRGEDSSLHKLLNNGDRQARC